MSTNFCIQDPQYPNSFLLHEALLNACKKSISGGGVYAFVTADGVNLLLDDKIFSGFIGKGKYTLIVGMDDITSEKALSKLKDMKNKYGTNLEVHAFLHNTKGSTFHPKFSWFKTNDGGTLILGSGNLTQKGLRKNREAFSVVEVDEAGISQIESEWKSWLAFNEKFLREIDDTDVVEKAKDNAINSKWIRINKSKKKEKEDQINIEDVSTDVIETPIYTSEEDDAWYFELQNKILFAEIPKSKDRWKQANFDKNTFETFFGAKCGQNGEYRVLLRNINKSGVMGEVEIRPAVSVASQNYRFELDAASGLSYPENGRPIALFVKISERTFLYELFMPDDSDYGCVLQFINAKSTAGIKLRRIVVTIDQCVKECPALALWNNLMDDEDFI